MKFIDFTEIVVRSGAGGPGLVSFKHARNMPKLGADGGDGGFGGSVYLLANSQLNTLSSIRYKKLYKAESGQRGGPNGRTGRDGNDLILEVPIGTIARNKDTGDIIGEVVEAKQKLMIAKGGKRGLGNIRFVSSTHQAPEEFTPGGDSIELTLELELKLIADVGFAGFPNAGKSTLLSRISAAKPKVADYPFTTLQPHLGVVDLEPRAYGFGKSFVAADIPGLIEGASDGKGLGIKFLRHLERTKVVAFIIDLFANEENSSPVEKYYKLRHELSNYSPEFLKKKSIVVLTKSDLVPENYDFSSVISEFEKIDLKAVVISAINGSGLTELKLELYNLIKSAAEEIEAVEGQDQVSEQPQLDEFELWKNE